MSVDHGKGSLIDTASWLARTRLHPPLQHDTVPRTRVHALLRTALEQRRLTLVAAPAGSGKTTLLADLPQIFPDLPLAWLSLDAADDDSTRFFSALIAALQRLQPACGDAASAMLTARAAPIDSVAHIQAVVTALINDLLETLPEPFLLVLDDLHVIESPAIYSGLDQLIAQMPAQMRLLIATRHDPPLSLARLRARRQLAELRLADLRFRDDEAGDLLARLLGFELSAETLADIQSRTEGWGAGLCLLAASLQARETPSARGALLDTLAHTDRYLFEFLAEEVLATLPHHLQSFLLKTAILAELTPALCSAVTERADASALLDEIYRRNLFVSLVSNAARAVPEPQPLQPVSPRTYRYHALFRSFLRQRFEHLFPEQLTELHRRAADAQPDTEQAIGHYLEGHHWQLAATAIIGAGDRLLQSGQLQTLRRWIALLPPSVYNSAAVFPCLAGIAAMLQGAYDEAQPLLERARQQSAACGDAQIEGEVLGALTTCAYLQGDFAAVGPLAEAALARPIEARGRIQVHMSRAGRALFTGDWRQAMQDLDLALDTVKEATQPYLLGVMLFNLSPSFAVLPDRLGAIERFCEQVTPVLASSFNPMRLALLDLQAFLHLWRGRLDQAIETGEAALALKARLGGHPILGLGAVTALADAYAAQGAYADAERCFNILFAQLAQQPLLSTAVRRFSLARLRLAQGRLDEAFVLAAQFDSISEVRMDLVPLARAMLQGLLAQSRGNTVEAEQWFRLVLDHQARNPLAALLGSARLLLARSLLEQGRDDAALAEFRLVLAECEQQGIAGPILLHGPLAVQLLRLAQARDPSAQLAARLLVQLGNPTFEATPPASASPPGYRAIPGSNELLSPREAEVLALLVAGASNRAIAEQLVISDATAKTHVARVLQKLGVNSRALASARARELGLA